MDIPGEGYWHTVYRRGRVLIVRLFDYYFFGFVAKGNNVESRWQVERCGLARRSHAAGYAAHCVYGGFGVGHV